MMASLYALLLFVPLAVLCFFIGIKVMDALRIRDFDESGAEWIVFPVALGMGIVAYVVLLLGLLRLIGSPVPFRALFGLGVLLLLPLAWSIVGSEILAFDLRRRGLWPTQSSDNPPASPLGKVIAVPLAALGFLTLIGTLAPPAGQEWDALSYHLAAPKEYLREGRIYYIPYDHHSNFPFLLQMLYMVMLGLESIGGAKLWHWLCGVLLVMSVYSFSARHVAPTEAGKRIGLVAALIVAATPIVLWEASVAYVDLATALYTWLSVYALFNAAQAVKGDALTLGPSPAAPGEGSLEALKASASPPDQSLSSPPSPAAPGEGGWGGEGSSLPWLIVSALMMGFALGTKYTVLGFWGMLLVGILVWHLATTRRWAKETIPHATLWGAVSLIVAAPWYVKTWLYTGNPVYPFYYGLFGGRYWNAENAALYAADQNKFGFGKTPIDLLLGPWQSTMEIGLTTPQRPFIFTEYTVFGLSPVYVALLLAAPLLARRMSRTAVWLSLFGLGVYAFWFFLMQQTRYLIPALPALAIIGAEALVRAWDDPARRLSSRAAAGLVAASAVWGLYLSAAQIAAPALPVVTGAMPQEEYIARRLGGIGTASLFINRNTPNDAKVALFDEVRGFYLDREYLWATPNHALLLPWEKYADADEWLADFKRRGYTTLLIGERSLAAPDDGQRWRSLLREAIAGDKVTLEFEGRTPRPDLQQGVRVYRIP